MAAKKKCNAKKLTKNGYPGDYHACSLPKGHAGKHRCRKELDIIGTRHCRVVWNQRKREKSNG